ncbi:unnamed protein product [Sphagnum jensenii]|uniref:Uncharacterized protein n=1 Tax=Sphagnum jensenii TaxID=128206 RepID=A0ABP1AK74_9BRYO
MLLCANLADLTPAGAAGGRGPAVAGVAGMLTGHGPLLVARDGGAIPGAAPGLSAGHEPLHVARGRGPTAVAAPGLSAGHRPLRAVRGHGPTVATGLRWTCGPNSPSYHAPGGEGMPDCSFLTSVPDSTHELVALERSKSIGVLSPNPS